MQTFDQCLQDLVVKGAVTFETAKAAASNPSDFELKMTMFSQDARASQPSVETPAMEGMQSGLDLLPQP
jgi:twitching motility protein PilT